jgi:hypothetical protein
MLNERRDKLPRGWGYGGGASKLTHTKTYNFVGESSEDSLRIKRNRRTIVAFTPIY